jgi:hypothetical protein
MAPRSDAYTDINWKNVDPSHPLTNAAGVDVDRLRQEHVTARLRSEGKALHVPGLVSGDAEVRKTRDITDDEHGDVLFSELSAKARNLKVRRGLEGIQIGDRFFADPFASRLGISRGGFEHRFGPESFGLN